MTEFIGFGAAIFLGYGIAFGDVAHATPQLLAVYGLLAVVVLAAFLFSHLNTRAEQAGATARADAAARRADADAAAAAAASRTTMGAVDATDPARSDG